MLNVNADGKIKIKKYIYIHPCLQMICRIIYPILNFSMHYSFLRVYRWSRMFKCQHCGVYTKLLQGFTVRFKTLYGQSAFSSLKFFYITIAFFPSYYKRPLMLCQNNYSLCVDLNLLSMIKTHW